jgi:hypothetical protein
MTPGAVGALVKERKGDLHRTGAWTEKLKKHFRRQGVSA